MSITTDIGSDFITAGARGLMALLQPATGSRSEGTATLVGADVVLRPGTYAYPVVGDERPDQLFKVKKNPDTEDGSWLVTSAGLVVTFVSNVGGAVQNLPIGTVLQMSPPIAGLSSQRFAIDAAFVGGADPVGYGALYDVVMANNLNGPAVSLDLQRSALKRFPSAVVSWEDTVPSDGSTVPQQGRRVQVGRFDLLMHSTYVVSVVSSRADSSAERRHQGLFLVGLIAQLLSGRNQVDTELVSNPSGVQLREVHAQRGPQEIYQKFDIYNLVFGLEQNVHTIDQRTYNEWLLTNLRVNKPADSGAISVVGGVDIEL